MLSGISLFQAGVVRLNALGLLDLLNMQIVQSSVILIKEEGIQFESFYEDMHCLICELKASFEICFPS